MTTGNTAATHKQSPVQLHLGCGKRFIPGFVHIDMASFPHIDFKRDLRDLGCLPSGYADLIYACHVLEYFDRIEVVDVLKEWRRVLKSGGTLRVAVPDMESLISVYRAKGNLSQILGPLFGRWEINPGTVVYHKTVYDFGSLADVLATAGFSGARRYDWRSTVHKEYDDFSQAYFPHMAKHSGTLISLNVEANKPGESATHLGSLST
jgi:predicted SAM-dependent methyltransferase